MNEDFELAEHTLGIKDYLGYSLEMANIEVLKKHGLYKYVVYRNPKNPFLWKRKKGFGVDMVLKVNDVAFYVEESFCQHDYSYRERWFTECRLTRFSKYPLSDNWHMRILLTNRLHNFNGVSDLAKKHGIQIMSINDLLTTIRKTQNRRDFLCKLCSNGLCRCGRCGSCDCGDSCNSNLLDYCSYYSNSNVTYKDTTKQIEKYVYTYDKLLLQIQQYVELTNLSHVEDYFKQRLKDG